MTDTLNAVLVTTDGTATAVTITRENFLTEAYAMLVSDTVEAVPVARDVTAWIDGEGLYQQEINRCASALCVVFYRYPAAGHLHGPVLFTGGVDQNGDELSLSADESKRIIALATFGRTGLGGAA